MEENILDDQYTIIYKYVRAFQQPKRFFVNINNKVIDIYHSAGVSQYFNPKDLLMVFYEQHIEISKGYQAWVIATANMKKYNKFINTINTDIEALEEYNMEDIIPIYGNLGNYFKKEEKIIYYNEEGNDIDVILNQFNRHRNTDILKELFTLEDYDNVLYEIKITPNAQLLEQLNQFASQYEELRYIKYDSKTFIRDYKEWIISIDKLYQKDLLTSNILDNQLLVKNNKYKSIKVGPVKTDYLVRIYNPTIGINNRPVDIHDGIYLFDEAKTTTEIPFVIYKNTEGVYYYKVHEETNTDLSIIKTIELENNTLFYNTPNLEVRYDLATNHMYVTFYNYNTTIVNILPINIDQTTQYIMNGHFNVWNVEINEATLAELILTNNIINTMFYVDDSDKNLEKKYFSLTYIPLLSNIPIGVKITQLYYETDKVVTTVENNKEQHLSLKKEKNHSIPYLDIKFKNVYNYEGFVTIIKMLLYLFNNNINKNDTYALEINTLNNVTTNEHEVDDNLKLLKNVAPNVFVEGYANFCAQRPKPINKTDIKAYMEKRIKDLNLDAKTAASYQDYGVLDFTLEGTNETLHLVCDHPDYMYPYLKSTAVETKMKNLNKTIYTEIPCCKKLPQKREKVVKQDITRGDLDKQIKYILNNYNKLDNHFTIYNVINDKNSLLHCVCSALQQVDYLHSKDKSSYVEQLLTTISNKTNFGLLKQELYDKDVDTIKTMFLNNVFLDPKLYYRALEEYFDINIYVFESENILDIPRFRQFHTRPLRLNRKTILIYKKTIEGPCELIFSSGKKSGFIAFSGKPNHQQQSICF